MGPHTHGFTYIWGFLFFITFFILQIDISGTFELPIFYAYALIVPTPHPLSYYLFTQWIEETILLRLPSGAGHTLHLR